MIHQKRNSAEWSQDSVAEYNVDEEGFLVDEDGNYMVDEYGDQIQISEEDLAELMRQQN